MLDVMVEFDEKVPPVGGKWFIQSNEDHVLSGLLLNDRVILLHLEYHALKLSDAAWMDLCWINS